VTEQNEAVIAGGGELDVSPAQSALGVTYEEFDALDDAGKEAVFVKAAVEQGTSEEDAKAVYQIITKLSPPIEALGVDIAGLGSFGDSQLRVAREYDTTIEAAGKPGHTDIILHSPLGPITFTVDKAALIAALTVEVPHVSPQKEPVDA